jgi:Transposase, Mutator family
VTVKVAYLVIGVDVEGRKHALGVWIAESEGAKFWLSVLTELRNRGLRDILICCCDGLTGLPEAITTAFPNTVVQTCVVHYPDIRIMPTEPMVPTVCPGQKGGRGLLSRHNPGCVSETSFVRSRSGREETTVAGQETSRPATPIYLHVDLAAEQWALARTTSRTPNLGGTTPARLPGEPLDYADLSTAGTATTSAFGPDIGIIQISG